LNTTAGNVQRYEDCVFTLTASGTRYVQVGAGVSGLLLTTWKNCDVSFSATGHRVWPVGPFVWDGGTVIDGGTDPTAIIGLGGLSGRGIARCLISGVDFSACSSSVNIFDTSSASLTGAYAVVRNSKLPASWSGGLVSTAPSSPGLRASMYNCDSTDTNYRLWIEDYAGSIKSETVIVRTGGASDGTTPLSWKVVSSANATFPGISAGWMSAPHLGPITFDSLYDGETYNATLAELWTGWDTPGFDAGSLGWLPAAAASSPANGAVISSQRAEPIAVVESVTAALAWATGPGATSFDFGRYVTGVLRVTLPPLPAGTVVTLRHAEILAHEPYAPVDGGIYTGTLRECTLTCRN
jgi:hypothetical protein